jgi:hypothetical protein
MALTPVLKTMANKGINYEEENILSTDLDASAPSKLLAPGLFHQWVSGFVTHWSKISENIPKLTLFVLKS